MFRYRQLLPTGNYDSSGSGNVDHGTALAGAVQDVNAEEGSATHDELVRKLKAGDLMPSDLVFSGGIWQPFSDAPEFYEHCVGVVDTRAMGMKARAIVIGLSLTVAIIVLRALLG